MKPDEQNWARGKPLVSQERRPGFTLIELLVVIAIIAILAAMLLPTLNKGQNKASQITDINNLKQITLTMNLYAGDNGDGLPLPNWDNGGPLGDGQYHAGWLYTPGAPGTNRFQVATGLFWDTLHNPKIYFCPMDKPELPGFSARAQQISSYAMNGAASGYMQGWDHPEQPTIRLSAMAADACAFWETDETRPDYFNDGANTPDEGVSARHFRGAIHASFTGSVRYIRLADWYEEVNETNKNRLWCYPASPDGR